MLLLIWVFFVGVGIFVGYYAGFLAAFVYYDEDISGSGTKLDQFMNAGAVIGGIVFGLVTGGILWFKTRMQAPEFDEEDDIEID